MLQRAAAHLASETDINESICLGKNGVKLAMEGKYMLGLSSPSPTFLKFFHLSTYCNKLRYWNCDIFTMNQGRFFSLFLKPWR